MHGEEKLKKMDNVHHIFAAIKQRWIDDSLLKDDGTLQIDDYAPVLLQVTKQNVLINLHSMGVYVWVTI